MSNIFHSTNLDKDYSAFEKALFKTNKFKFQLTPILKSKLKKYHQLTYAIALIEKKLEEKYPSEHKFLFVNEIISDLLSNSSIIFIGFYYASQILTRRLIENFYNHIYYFEHPVEYELLNLGRNEYTPIIELKNYFEIHPIIKPIVDLNIKKYNDELFQHYQDLCRTVHTKGEDFMGLAKNLEEIKPEFEIDKHFDNTIKSLMSMLYLLYKFHYEITFSNIEKDLISKSFHKNIRKSLFA
jgi:hypothetical protein